MAKPTFGMGVFEKEFTLITKIAVIMYGMYILNGLHGPEPRSPGGNTSSNPQVFTLIPRPTLNGIERMSQRHGSNQNSNPSTVVKKRYVINLYITT